MRRKKSFCRAIIVLSIRGVHLQCVCSSFSRDRSLRHRKKIAYFYIGLGVLICATIYKILAFLFTNRVQIPSQTIPTTLAPKDALDLNGALSSMLGLP